MKNLEKKSLKSEIQVYEIGDMLKLIALEHPEIKDYEKLSQIISSKFNVICTPDDIQRYEYTLNVYKHKQDKYYIKEDYELESRRQEYGIKY
jgi:hypothetical protein